MFGARAAYSLWSLPLIRFVLPEIPLSIKQPDWVKTMPNFTSELITTPNTEVMLVAPEVTQTMGWQIPILMLWLAGAILWMGEQLWRQSQYMKQVQEGSKPAPQRIQAKITAGVQALKLKRTPTVIMAATNVGPMVSGLIRPTVILPRDFETDFDGRQQYFALVHELAHIKRRDLWAAFATLVFRALNWPNPLVHLSASKFRADQEAACDAYVLKIIDGGPQATESYAETLIHSAKLTRNPNGEAVQTNPLCLTIYHPLKERLMTIKTSKNNSTILSRVGVAGFLIAALAVTAPITIAAAQDNLAGEPKVETKTKKVMKWVEKKDGVETKKTYEILTEDGVTKAYQVDDYGNKTEVEMSEIEGMHVMDGENMMFLHDGGEGQKRIKIVGGDHMTQTIDIEGLHEMGDGEHNQVFIKRMKKGGDGTEIDIDSNVFVMDGGSHAVAMVEAAKGLLDQAEAMNGGDEISDKAKRKIEKARKALAEAQAALEEE
jgi:beta-lactamase regulating signal transducer with metallopeptidase domain